MKRQQRPAGAGQSALRSHHIDQVAHHFLSAAGEASSADVARICRDVAVAAPGSGRAAACAAAGLAAAATGRPGWGSCLVEDESVAWSAFSYLGGPEPGALPPPVREDLPPGLRARWLAAGAGAGAGPAAWWRWRLLGEASAATLGAWEVPSGLPAPARAAPPRWAALVWCVVASEAAAPEPAACLRRLLALLRPARLEFLVVPDAWESRPGLRRPGSRRADPGWRNLAHLQEIARAAAGPADACVRVYPQAPGAAGDPGPVLLARIAEAIAGEPA